jgi:hypothetical protein
MYDDVQLALYCAYELHYRGFAGVDDRWEWEPSLLGLRAELERSFEDELAEAIGPLDTHADRVVDDLWALAAPDAEAPSLSRWLVRHGNLWHARELAVHRSAYQLKEADPHTWAVPRLDGQAKAVLVAIQFDEYGEGAAEAMHASLFARTMEALGLDSSYGAYVDALPGTTLAATNLISLLGLHRRLRGALVGHLALFEMTSVLPMGRYSRWSEQLGLGVDARRFYDTHVRADAVHQHLAADGMVRGLVDRHPEQAASVLFGARALDLVEGRFAQHLMSRWGEGRTTLVRPLAIG